MTARVNPGAVIEIPTPHGFAYAVFSHKVPSWGSLIHVARGLHGEQPEIAQLDLEDVILTTFFPLNTAVHRGIANVVGQISLPRGLRRMPRFRDRGSIDKEGNVLDWWVEGRFFKTQVRTLSEAQRKMPIRQVVNDTALVNMILERNGLTGNVGA